MSALSKLKSFLQWARSAEEASGVPGSAKYFYDASKELNRGELAAQSDAETERLIRAAQQGHNAVVMRYSDPPRTCVWTMYAADTFRARFQSSCASTRA